MGASLPTLSIKLSKSEEELGIIFTARGIGYLLGTLGSAGVLNYPSITLSKQNLTSISIFISGLCMMLIQSLTHFRTLLFVFGIQGIAFGGIDTFANCALPELWKLDTNPWMQSMHASFGIGALVGPALVGHFKFNLAFHFIAYSSLVPIFGIIVTYYCCNSTNIDIDNEENKEGIEMLSFKDVELHEVEEDLKSLESMKLEGKQVTLIVPSLCCSLLNII